MTKATMTPDAMTDAERIEFLQSKLNERTAQVARLRSLLGEPWHCTCCVASEARAHLAERERDQLREALRLAHEAIEKFSAVMYQPGDIHRAAAEARKRACEAAQGLLP